MTTNNFSLLDLNKIVLTIIMVPYEIGVDKVSQKNGFA